MAREVTIDMLDADGAVVDGSELNLTDAGVSAEAAAAALDAIDEPSYWPIGTDLDHSAVINTAGESDHALWTGTWLAAFTATLTAGAMYTRRIKVEDDGTQRIVRRTTRPAKYLP